MNALRESYLLTENENNFDTIFSKLNIYSYKKNQIGNRLNESRFNARYDIAFTLEEQKAIKDLFKIFEYRLLESYQQEINTINEGIKDTAKNLANKGKELVNNITGKAKAAYDFFKELLKEEIQSASQFINKIIELIMKVGETLKDFIAKVFGFDGFETSNVNIDTNSQKILEGIPSNEQGFLSCVINYCQNNLSSSEIKNAAQELGNVNEDFNDKLDHFLETNKFFNSKFGKLLMGDREKVGGGKISLWKTIGVSIAGSLILCTIVPWLCSVLIGPGLVTTCIVVGCKCIWVARGVMKVLYHRNKRKKPEEQRFFNFWTVFQLILVVGTPILFAIPGVKEAVNKWVMDAGKWVCDKLGITDGVKNIMEWLGMGETKVVQEARTEIKDPNDIAKEVMRGTAKNPLTDPNSVSGDHFHKVGMDFRSFFKRPDFNMNTYNQDLCSKLHLPDQESRAGLYDLLSKFNKLKISGPDVYNEIDGKLEGCKNIMLYADTSDPKHGMQFFNAILKVCKEKGMNLATGNNGDVEWGNMINQAAYAATKGNRGAIELLSTQIPATRENLEIFKSACQEVIKQAHPGGNHPVFGVLNKVMDNIETTKDAIKSFVPHLDFGGLYMPIYKKLKDKKNLPATTGGTELVTTPPPVTTIPEIEGLILHNNASGKDYRVTKVELANYSQVKNILPNAGTVISKMVNVEQSSIASIKKELEESLKAMKSAELILESQFGKNYKKLFEADNQNTNPNSEQNNTNDSKAEIFQKNMIIKNEEEGLKNIQSGNFKVVVFYGSTTPINENQNQQGNQQQGNQQQGNQQQNTVFGNNEGTYTDFQEIKDSFKPKQNNNKLFEKEFGDGEGRETNSGYWGQHWTNGNYGNYTYSSSGTQQGGNQQGGNQQSAQPAQNGNGNQQQNSQNALVPQQKGNIVPQQKGDIVPSNKGEVLMVFSPIFGFVGINEKIIENNVKETFMKGLFNYYSFKYAQKNAQVFQKNMALFMTSMVIETYEVVKFYMAHMGLIQNLTTNAPDTNNFNIMPGQNAGQNNFKPHLGNFKVSEFCDIHNNKVNSFQFYDAKYSDGKKIQQPKNQGNQNQGNGNNGNQNQGNGNTQQSNGQGNSNNSNQNGAQTAPNGQSTSANTNQQQKPWYKRMWNSVKNWVTGKKNEGFDFDNSKINVIELYEMFNYLKSQGEID